MATAAHPRAYRPYRVTLYVLFIAIAGTLALLFLGSIVRDLGARPPVSTRPRRALFQPGQPLAKGAYLICVDRLEDRHDELGARFAALPQAAAKRGSAALDGWQDFSRTWQEHLERDAATCGLGQTTGRHAEALQILHDRLVDLHRIYATEATRLLRENGDAIQATEAAFGATHRPGR